MEGRVIPPPGTPAAEAEWLAEEEERIAARERELLKRAAAAEATAREVQVQLDEARAALQRLSTGHARAEAEKLVLESMSIVVPPHAASPEMDQALELRRKSLIARLQAFEAETAAIRHREARLGEVSEAVARMQLQAVDLAAKAEAARRTPPPPAPAPIPLVAPAAPPVDLSATVRILPLTASMMQPLTPGLAAGAVGLTPAPRPTQPPPSARPPPPRAPTPPPPAPVRQPLPRQPTPAPVPSARPTQPPPSARVATPLPPPPAPTPKLRPSFSSPDASFASTQPIPVGPLTQPLTPPDRRTAPMQRHPTPPPPPKQPTAVEQLPFDPPTPTAREPKPMTLPKAVPRRPTPTAVPVATEPLIPARKATPAREEHRASRRVKVKTEVTLSSESNFFTGFSGDLSEGGVFVATYESLLPPGTHVELAIALQDQPEVHVGGVVKWVRDPDRTTGVFPGMGIAFENVQPEAQKAIRRFLHEREPMFFEE